MFRGLRLCPADFEFHEVANNSGLPGNDSMRIVSLLILLYAGITMTTLNNHWNTVRVIGSVFYLSLAIQTLLIFGIYSYWPTPSLCFTAQSTASKLLHSNLSVALHNYALHTYATCASAGIHTLDIHALLREWTDYIWSAVLYVALGVSTS